MSRTKGRYLNGNTKRYCKLCSTLIPKTKRIDALYCDRRCKRLYSKGYRNTKPISFAASKTLVFKGNLADYVEFLEKFYNARKEYYV